MIFLGTILYVLKFRNLENPKRRVLKATYMVDIYRGFYQLE